MRHIKKSQLIGLVSDDWKARALAVTQSLQGKTPEERRDIFSKNSALWSELKTLLSQQSHGKCWYSEARVAVTELEVEHFRPKARVTDTNPVHRGYWWLAFDWENYRLSYSLINKRRTDLREGDVLGKGNYFPLLDESQRVGSDNAASIDGEQPTLIDPFRAADVSLLDYAVEEGRVVEKYDEIDQNAKWNRANRSIDLYHLNEGTLIQDRVELYAAVIYIVNQIEAINDRLDRQSALSDDEQNLDDAFNRLGDIISPASPYSAFTRACLLQLGDRGWNMHLVAAA